MKDRRIGLRNLLSELEDKKALFLLVYTMVFVITFMIVFALFILEGKSLIWKIDGYDQHLKSLMYIRKYYTEFILSHKLPSYDFNIGLGGNPFIVLTYYGFFDPINFISVLVPWKYTDYLYSFLTMIRIYLSGLSFIYMCRYFGNRRWHSIIGSIIYLTTSYVLILGLKHPFFLNPMIYFPLLIVGLNKILKKEKPYLFIFGISFSALSGFYFLYMMTIMLFVYANIRFLELNKKSEYKIKKYFLTVLQVVMYYILSCGLVAVVLLPQILAFLNSDRVGKTAYGSIFSHLRHVTALFYVHAGTHHLSVSSIVFFTIILAVFRYRKERPGLVFLIILSIVGMGLPWIGRIMNGFSYPSNRWMFGTALLLSYLFVVTLPALIEDKERKWMLALIIGMNLVYFIIMMLSKKFYLIANILVLDMIYTVVYKLPVYLKKRNKRFSYTAFSIMFLFIIIGNSALISFFTYTDSDFMSTYMSYDNNKKYKESQEAGFQAVSRKRRMDEAKAFYRVDGSDFKVNLSMIAGIPNSSLYFSIINSYMGEFFEELQIANHNSRIYFTGMDGRAVAGNLISNKFFLASDEESGELPYGYRYKEKIGKYKLYQNKDFLPFGYTYDKYLTYDEVEGLFSLDKEANMLEHVYLEKEIPQIKKGEITKYAEEVDHKVKTGEGVVYREHEFIDFSAALSEKKKRRKEKKSLNKDKAYMKLLFDLPEGKEAYLYLKGFLPDERYSNLAFFMRSNKVRKKDSMRSKRSAAYFDRNDYLFHIGNADKKKTACSFYLDELTKCSISDIRILAVSLEGYEEKIKKLKKDSLQNVEFGVNRVTGEIKLTEPKILAMSIPYEKGWTAYVDGKKTELLRGNYMFSCLALEKGEHRIELRYHTYGMKAAMIINIVSLIGLVCIVCYHRRSSVKEYQ